MSLAPGSRLGPYDVIVQIGVGGMGEVYRARDTRLGRDVALKILPEAFAQDADRLARFRREAQVLASLNHPNIAQIHGLEDSGGTHALVMELVEGPTLADRIAEGPIRVDEALPVAKQIAEALEAAHEHGIIHRDLKPANIKVRDDGTVKVLDFGLAKAMEPAGALISASVSQSPTITTPAMTQMGMILGTAAYMAPEQARGRPVDKRADIWAFGCVLYEMVTGRRPFAGDDVGETLAAVIKEQPSMDVVPADVRPLVESCLQKDPRARLRDIGDAWRIAGDAPSDSRAPTPSRWPWIIAAASIFLAGAVGFSGGVLSSTPAVVATTVRLDADVGAAVSRTSREGPPFAISPDGARLALVTPGADGRDRLSLRLLSSAETTVLAGTEGAMSPFFSPDGRSVAFFAAGKLKKISVEGGTPVVLSDATDPRGGSWGDDGNIIFAAERRVQLSRVSSAGGEVTPASTLDTAAREVTNRFPQVLPGAEAFLFESRPDAGVYSISVQSIRTGERKVLVEDGYHGIYAPSGHLVFTRQAQLYAAPMDLARLELTGPAVPIVQDLNPGYNGWAYVGLSAAGTLVYLAAEDSGDRTVEWVDQSGRRQPLPIAPGPYQSARVSPDATMIALLARESAETVLWLYDVAQARLSRVGSIRGARFQLTWAPDGRHLVYTVSEGGPDDGIYWMRADGAGAPVLLVQGSSLALGAVAPDGRHLGYCRTAPYGLWTVALGLSDPDRPTAGDPESFLQSDAEVRGPAFSPDGRWVSYTSLESGRAEVYVRPFPGSGRQRQVSPSGTGGGVFPRSWSSGNRLHYTSNDGRLQVLDYRTDGASFNVSLPRPWSSEPLLSGQLQDLAADGSRLLVLTRPNGAAMAPASQLTFVLNFFERLRDVARPGAR